MTTNYMIVQGDTIYGIAQKTLGDASYAMLIAKANNLQYPFITDIQDTTVTTACPGDIIVVPEISSNVVQETKSFEYSDIALSNLWDAESPIYNTGMRADESGDLKVCSGQDSLMQDLNHRLFTELNTLLLHPTYGGKVTSIVGTKGTSYWEKKVAIEVERVFSTDPRVTRVTNVVAQRISTGVNISCTIYYQGGVLVYDTTM